MDTTKLSSKGQVIIPKHIRDLHNWNAGLELEVIELDDGIMLKTKSHLPAHNAGGRCRLPHI